MGGGDEPDSPPFSLPTTASAPDDLFWDSPTLEALSPEKRAWLGGGLGLSGGVSGLGDFMSPLVLPPHARLLEGKEVREEEIVDRDEGEDDEGDSTADEVGGEQQREVVPDQDAGGAFVAPAPIAWTPNKPPRHQQPQRDDDLASLLLATPEPNKEDPLAALSASPVVRLRRRRTLPLPLAVVWVTAKA